MVTEAQMKQAFQVGELAQKLVQTGHNFTKDDDVIVNAMTLSFVVSCLSRGMNLEEMKMLVTEICGQAQRGASIQETAQ